MGAQGEHRRKANLLTPVQAHRLAPVAAAQEHPSSPVQGPPHGKAGYKVQPHAWRAPQCAAKARTGGVRAGVLIRRASGGPAPPSSPAMHGSKLQKIDRKDHNARQPLLPAQFCSAVWAMDRFVPKDRHSSNKNPPTTHYATIGAADAMCLGWRASIRPCRALDFQILLPQPQMMRAWEKGSLASKQRRRRTRCCPGLGSQCASASALVPKKVCVVRPGAVQARRGLPACADHGAGATGLTAVPDGKSPAASA